MELAVLLNLGESRVTSQRAWMKAHEFSTLCRAAEVMQEARIHLAQLQAAAVEEAAVARSSAHEQGHREGLLRAAEEVAAAGVRAAAKLRSMDGVIAQAVMAVLSEVVQDIPADRLYEVALRKAARVLHSEARLCLRVPPQHEAEARQALDRLSQDGVLGGCVELCVDGALQDHACILESEAGVVSAGLDVQIEAFGRAVAAEVSRLVGERTAAAS